MAEDELEVADLERAEVHETEAHLALGTWHLAEAQRLPERPTAMEQARSVANAEEVAHRPLLIIGLTPSPESQGFARAPRRTRAFVAL